MTYKELVDLTTKNLGTMNYPIFGRLCKKYKPEYIVECVERFPEDKKKLDPTGKSIYLGGICRANAKSANLNKDTKPLNMDGFSI